LPCKEVVNSTVVGEIARQPWPTTYLPQTTSYHMPLSGEDHELRSAYEKVGRPLDALPYTDDFEKLLEELGKPKTQAIRHAVFQRLLSLRKRDRLPRVSEM
jgi:hypothetical protein